MEDRSFDIAESLGAGSNGDRASGVEVEQVDAEDHPPAGAVQDPGEFTQ